jgi:DNA-binding transcriptional ArsR family regulator
MSDEDVGAVFAALSDPTRRSILRMVAEGEASTASRLAERLPVSRQAVTKHLTALADAGLVEARRDGREVVYRMSPGPMTEAAGWMADVGAAWDVRLARLRRSIDRGR